jgi:hypothetical protein
MISSLSTMAQGDTTSKPAASHFRRLNQIMKLLKVRDELHLVLKKMALGKGITMQALIEELLGKLTEEVKP